MWQLTKLSAHNICAFEKLDYEPIQNQTTLIFGNNMDNESQNSNGSGKSALIEALAIGITGEPLRKVNADEIINDRFDEAKVSITLLNNESGKRLTVVRKLSRKSPQDIQIIMTTPAHPDGEEEIKQASVSDYNKYVLDQIGLSKDDILRNFILTARKYQSFLSCSDKEKKEIINRFSNGIIVDESIEELRKDIEPIQQKFLEAEKKLAEFNGRVSALSDEIDRNINESVDRKKNREERVNRIKSVISEKRESIRLLAAEKDAVNAQLDAIEELDVSIQALEKSGADTTASYKSIKEQIEKNGLSAISDFELRISNNRSKLHEVSEELESLNRQSIKSVNNIDHLAKSVESIEQSNNAEFDKIDHQHSMLEREIIALQEKVKKLKSDSDGLVSRRSTINSSIASLEKQLAGVIKCPNCRHEFTLKNDVDVNQSRALLSDLHEQLEDVEKHIAQSESNYVRCVSEGRTKRSDQSKLYDLKLPLQKRLAEAQNNLENAKTEYNAIISRIEAATERLKHIQGAIDNMRTEMFDETFTVIDNAINKGEKRLSDIGAEITMAHSSIKAYEEQIVQLENTTDDDILLSLKESKAKYEQELSMAEKNKELILESLNRLKVQESNFIEFKTYLANNKINAIAQMTNDFLSAIGSDIRVSLSGYTTLKSGKVRDKISVSLIRDGVDCGSFDKFSAGEKRRVELASILSLHKLSNVNCDGDKGLNLLVIDEILDCTDESGLANVFKALNDTQVTALVVSHGNIAENYPNRLVVTKQNGVSILNEK